MRRSALIVAGRQYVPRGPVKALRRIWAPHLEQFEVVIWPENLPEHAGLSKVRIGEDVPDRRLMARWMGLLGFELDILADYLFAEVKKGGRVFADETTRPTLRPGSGAAKKVWLWACARDDRPFGGQAPPMVVCRFEDSRCGGCVRRHHGGYSGIPQVDDIPPVPR